ncbi:MAG: glucoamylase family protein [Bacteroidota bacterium]
MTWIMLITALSLFSTNCDKDKSDPENADILRIQSVKAGEIYFSADETNENVPVNRPFTIRFNKPVDTAQAEQYIQIKDNEDQTIEAHKAFSLEGAEIKVTPDKTLEINKNYQLQIGENLRGADGSRFPGINYDFVTVKTSLKVEEVLIDGENFMDEELYDVSFTPTIEARFNQSIDTGSIDDAVVLSYENSIIPLDVTLSENNTKLKAEVNSPLEYYRPHTLTINENIAGEDISFSGYSNRFITQLDSTNKFPEISEEALLTKIQEQTFKYFWDYGHPSSGMARERLGSGNTVTSGGSGFGIMSLIVGIERDFITRQQGLDRLDKILSFLEEAERFHGAWSHWINGETGEAIAFSPKDDGGDLVETAFLIQGLLTFRQYLEPGNTEEQALIARIDTLWETVEWDWYTQGENALYWHWSPNHDFEMNMRIQGHNETSITYILAAASPTHSISPEVYHEGYARNGGMVNGNAFYSIPLPLGYDYGGPLFFTHYSFLGLNPNGLEDDYGNYWEQNLNHTRINRKHCIENPNGYAGYSKDAWGLTASDNHEGYSAHSPTNDLGVITPTAAISSIPYTPEYSMDAIEHFYYKMGDRLWGEYGFYDAFNVTEDWYANSYLAIDQGPIIIMIENHRTELLWDLFMSHQEIQEGLEKLNYQYQK